MNPETLTQEAIAFLKLHGPNVLLAIVTLVLGLWIIRRVVKLFRRGLEVREMEPALRTFLGSLVDVLLKALLIISVISMLGIPTTSFVAILGAAGLAIGLALQGSLGNFAGGVLILLFKPFRIGDLIQAQGYIGHVQAINIFVTTLLTPDNKTVILPNGPLSNDSLTNLTTAGKLRVDLTIGIDYEADIKKARNVIMEIMRNHPKVLDEPAPSVNVMELADNSVNLAVRPYAKPEDYWTVYFEITEAVKEGLDATGIGIPYPQRVVHLVRDE
ncbi:MAG: mechanosensitive ion channel family protein [Bacteroidetes bacterium]|nr:MAG: mechanosensitive ion channel family protein [Bacteroidota bacterium]